CHVRIASKQASINAVRVSAGEADLLLGCDLVVSSGFEALAKVSNDRTHAIINAAEVPTSAFILNPDMPFPQQTMRDKIVAEVGAQNTSFLDSNHIATALLGDSIASNLFLLGYAWQSGLVPVSATALDQAIVLNGVEVEFNQQAFLWGRRYAHQPDRVKALFKAQKLTRPLSLDELIENRARRLTAYQNTQYAEKYRDYIEQIRAIDSEPFSMTGTVAKNLYRLMAYKDEYEVSRLFCQREFIDEINQQFEGDFKLGFNLAPAILNRLDKNTGRPVKYAFGGWMMKVFSMLSAMKALRGTAFDPFGYSFERRQERGDIDDYLALLAQIKSGITKENYTIACELCESVASLRGFGPVKTANREKLHKQQEELLGRFRATSP
ncbi:MAG: indolepyruvate ferredoxin oxidoreductase family protein, partial [Gammaproteobacteria bacterium]|nr:indolepyruvate ferredoxin oxidoreductase family protein [Gammaproteobacteria bacterium]